MSSATRSLSLAILLLTGATALAQSDRVRTNAGTQTGEVTEVRAVGIKLKRGSQERDIPTSEIRSVRFGGEPSELTQARVNAVNGGYSKALAALKKIDVSKVTDKHVKQEIAFYSAYCHAKRALLGEETIASGGREIGAFVSGNRDSFHYLEANVLVGDLLAALGKYPEAQRRYELLARTPWPAYKTRSAVLVARALQAQDKHAEAISRFETAESLADDSDEGKQQRLAAKLGRAISLTATGKVDQGVRLVRGVIADANPDDQALHAQAHNALGGCYNKAGKEKAALFAYLHVDLLYNNQPAAHAEALYHLAKLWDSIGKTGEARDARQRLKARYASTQWAKQ